MLKSAILLALVAFVASELEANYEGAQLLRMKLTTPAQLKAVTLLETFNFGVDFWLEPSMRRPVDIYIPQIHLEAVKLFLKDQGIEFDVSIPDVGALISEQKKTNHPSQEDMDWENYHRYDTIMTFVDRMAADYPDLATVEQYGTSTLGRPLNVIKIGRNVTGESKPSFFLDGGIHAREWISPAIVTWFMRELLENSDSYGDILDGMDIYITPIANPDGYDFTHTNQRLWRKTRSNHDSPLGCIGVDPNRNFEYEWGGPGTSPDKCSDIYKGPAPWSEPETRSMKDFIENKQHEGVQWVSYFAVHSYAQMWLVPWGWTYLLPPTYDELMDFGHVGAAALAAVHGTEYEVGSVTELLSPGAGGSDDWAYGSEIFRYSQTVEVRDTGRYGFILPPDQIIPCAEETFAAIAAVARFVLNGTLAY